MRVRFSRWSGTQEPFGADVTAEELLDELSDDLIDGVPAEDALRRLLQRGMSGMRGRVAGLDELRRRVEQARRRELERLGLEGPLRQMEERLGEIVERERLTARFSADTERGQARLDELDALPADLAARVDALRGSEWMDPAARADFDALLEELRRQVAEATFGRLAGALGSMSPEDLERSSAMLGELNALADRHARGEDVAADFAEFKARYADLIPGDPATIDELLEELARRMAAMSRLLASLDPEQRAQLAQLAEQLLGDLDLSFQAEQLSRTLESMFPELGWDQAVPGAQPAGELEGSLSATAEWMEHLQSYDELGEALRQDYAGARLEDVDEEALCRALGEDAARDLRALREIERLLEEAGALRRRQGRLELTPKGMRQLGERALARIYERALSGEPGGHRTPLTGGEGEPTGSTRPLRFGDPFRVDVSRTIFNAVGQGGVPVRVRAEHFELAEAERRVRTSTVLLLDMSFSMPLRGNWGAAKRLALALSSLASSKFPEDRFHVVGFSDYARRMAPEDLLVTGWERVYGTNMQHAFMIARRLLAQRPGDRKQVIMVTDGEPTAHLEGDVAAFAWPPEPDTLRKTMAEALRLARSNTTLNVFLLDHDPGAAQFVERMVRRCGGRIFHPDLDDLGDMVVREFLAPR
ncbi:MAG TPA: VWA domain-containing protein [Egibacteraceae bacterium]|nr:VWA domain-containing protein [Egibacteraceae bacterium]